MTTTETNLQRDAREMTESQARLRAEMAKSPQFVAMSEAAELTKDEQAVLDAAQAKVSEAEAAVGAAGLALNRARRGQAPVKEQDAKHPFGFFLKRPETHRAAAAALPGLTSDLAEARMAHQSAIRRYNALTADVNRARLERRRVAKVANAPQVGALESHADGWHTIDALARWSGKDAS